MGEDRYTFSQTINTLIEVKSKVIDFYRATIERTGHEVLKEKLQFFVKEDLDFIDSLNKVRRMSVVEMSLEPITGLKLNDYSIQIRGVIGDKDLTDLQKVRLLEDIMQELFEKTSKKVMYASADSSVLLDRLSQESSRRRQFLKSIPENE